MKKSEELLRKFINDGPYIFVDSSGRKCIICDGFSRDFQEKIYHFDSCIYRQAKEEIEK